MATDPCLVNNGSWDTTLAIPTNATPGALVTGTGEGWSMPSLSNLVTDGWFARGFYGGGDWAVRSNATTTSINFGSDATIDNIPAGDFTWECRVLLDSAGGNNLGRIFDKGDVFRVHTTPTQINFHTSHATSNINTNVPYTPDGKWHHVEIVYDIGTLTVEHFFLDGIDLAAGAVTAVGAYVGDAAASLYGCNSAAGIRTMDGVLGWMRFSNNKRHTADFIPPRTLPAVDGNTIEQWTFNEGTGSGPNTLIAQVTSPANDGDLSNGTWERQWAPMGTPPEFHGVDFNGADTSCVVPDAAGIQNLHDGALTIRAWVRADGWGENSEGRIIDKTDGAAEGYYLTASSTHGIEFVVYCATTNAIARCGTDDFKPDGKLHLITAQFDDGGSRIPYLWVDDIPVSTYTLQQAGVGAVVSDIGNNLYIGNRSAGDRTWNGFIGGWLNLSNVLRNTMGECAVPNGPLNPPALPDANSVWQSDFSDGAGATLTDDSATGSNGTLTNYLWRNSYDMNILSPGSRIYGGQGLIVGSNGANDGILQTWTGLAAGADYYLRVVGHPGPDSNGALNLLVYDEIGAANITSFNLCKYTGTHTGANNSATLIAPAGTFSQRQVDSVGSRCRVWNITDGSFGPVTAVSGDGTTITAALAGGTDNDWDTGDVFRITWSQTGSVGNVVDRYPNVEDFGIELPAGCTSISVRLQETGGSGEWLIHQVSLHGQLWQDPGFETGTAPTNVGTPTTSAQSAVQAHAGTNSWRVITDAIDEGIQRTINVTSGNYYLVSGWIFADTANTVDLNVTGAVFHDGTTTTRVTTVNNIWQKLGGVVRATAATMNVRFLSNVAVQTFYVDDVAVIADTAVSLTCTPANLANSTEGTGVRVDGYDRLTQVIPPGSIFATEGWLRIQVTPRHDIGDMRSFGNLTPRFGTAWGDATNYIYWNVSAANTVTLGFNAGGAGLQAGNWAAAGAVLAANNYVMEVIYDAAQMRLVCGGVTRITIVAAVNFTTIPTTFYAGTDQTGLQQVDSAFSSP